MSGSPRLKSWKLQMGGNMIQFGLLPMSELHNHQGLCGSASHLDFLLEVVGNGGLHDQSWHYFLERRCSFWFVSITSYPECLMDHQVFFQCLILLWCGVFLFGGVL